MRANQSSEKRRKHPHFRVIVNYTDQEVFGRVYTNLGRAEKFAARQRKSPVVKSVSILRVR
jgi:hypothetical protein